jgi:hypothetical protein
MKKTDFCVLIFWRGLALLLLLLLQTTTQLLLLHRDRSGLTLMLGGPALLNPPHTLTQKPSTFAMHHTLGELKTSLAHARQAAIVSDGVDPGRPTHFTTKARKPSPHSLTDSLVSSNLTHCLPCLTLFKYMLPVSPSDLVLTPLSHNTFGLPFIHHHNYPLSLLHIDYSAKTTEFVPSSIQIINRSILHSRTSSQIAEYQSAKVL